jgi:hypothetical protein
MAAAFDHDEHFITASLTAGAGFPAIALQYLDRYRHVSLKRAIEKSFAKATSKKKLQ